MQYISDFFSSIVDTLIPPLGVPSVFWDNLDGAVAFIIQILGWASWFIPLDLLVMCFLAMIAVDNFGRIVQISKWAIGIIRG